jgi:hypothetical protein
VAEALSPAPEAGAEAEVVSVQADGGGTPPDGARHPHTTRFWVVRAALGAILGMAAAVAVAIAMSPAPGPDKSWSPWHPSKSGVNGVHQIAEHVAPMYHLPNGDQLVLVQGGPLEFASLPAKVALESSPTAGTVSLLGGDTILYTLCGLGPKCAIRTGKASPERHLLLRRESLELALYTFHYVGGVDQVVTLLPPRKGSKPSQAMLFRKGDVGSELGRPLQETLPLPPPLPQGLDGAQGGVINRLTAPNPFKFRLEQSQDAGVLLILDRLVG